MQTVFDVLARACADREISMLLVGAYALQAHGVIRQTIDVDAIVPEKDIADLELLLLEAGYQKNAETANFARYSHPEEGFEDLDILFSDASTFQKLAARSKETRFDDGIFRVPCVSHLIAMKSHAVKNNPARESKDLGDIVALLRMNPNEVSDADLEEIIGKYGPEGFYSKLKDML